MAKCKALTGSAVKGLTLKSAHLVHCGPSEDNPFSLSSNVRLPMQQVVCSRNLRGDYEVTVSDWWHHKHYGTPVSQYFKLSAACIFTSTADRCAPGTPAVLLAERNRAKREGTARRGVEPTHILPPWKLDNVRERCTAVVFDVIYLNKTDRTREWEPRYGVYRRPQINAISCDRTPFLQRACSDYAGRQVSFRFPDVSNYKL